MLSDYENAFVARVERAMGKPDALLVHRLFKARTELAEEVNDGLYATMAQRRLDQLGEEHRRTLEVVWEVKRLLEQDPVPLDELRRLVKEALRTPPADPGEVLPFPAGAPR